MPPLLKNPKFIAAVIIVLWVVYVLTENFRPNPIQITLLPFATLHINLSAVIIGAALFGAGATLAGQWLWRRRGSFFGSSSPLVSGTPGVSNKTSA